MSQGTRPDLCVPAGGLGVELYHGVSGAQKASWEVPARELGVTRQRRWPRASEHQRVRGGQGSQVDWGGTRGLELKGVWV